MLALILVGLVAACAAAGDRYNCSEASIAQIVANFTDLLAVSYNSSAITATAVSNYTAVPDVGGPFFTTSKGNTFCNVTLSMTHVGLNDTILMQFWLPATAQFKNRYLSSGGGGWSVGGAGNLPAGLSYGAVSGATDGGFGGFQSQLTSELLSPVPGTIVWSRLESFAYQAIHEMIVTGKELTNAFYGLANDTLKSYYIGCSEGGREGHMSTQRYPLDFDGVIAAAPAMFFSTHQLAQGWPAILMAQQQHWPSPCAFVTVLNDTIAACDALDGRADGVVSRSDLCQYDAYSSVGHTFTACTLGGVGSPTNGTITAADVKVINAIYKGAFDSDDNQIFWAYRNATRLNVEAVTSWNATSQSYVSGQSMFFNAYYQNLVAKNPASGSLNYSDFTVDAVYQLMLEGLQDYGSWTQTTWPDLSNFQAHGGKLIHWHGEADTNLFPEASAHFHEKVRNHMFPNSTDYDEINEFYRFFIVPGAGHCSINPYQPSGPFPQRALEQLISWVEDGVAPDYLNGTTEAGTSTQETICLWPTRPQWSSSGAMSCANETVQFIHPLNGWKVDY